MLKRSKGSPSSKRGSGFGRWSPLGSVLFLAALWAVPMVAIALSVFAKEQIEASSLKPLKPEAVMVGLRNDSRIQGVDIAFSIGDSPRLQSTALGVVTSVMLSRGESPTAGQPLFGVDGVPVIAYSGDTPFYRDLVFGMKGEDAKTLGALLVATGDLSAELASDEVSYSMLQALRTFQIRMGVESPDVLRPENYVFLGSSFGAVTAIQIQLGQPTPGDGVVALGTGQMGDVKFLQPSDGMPIQKIEEGVVLQAGDEQLELSGSDIPEGARAGLLASLLDWAESGLVTKIQGEGGAISYSGLTLSLQAAVPVGTVPNTAVLVDEKGAACVLKVDGSATSKFVPVITEVEPASAELGTTNVNAELAGAKVLRDVSTQEEAVRSCLSK